MTGRAGKVSALLKSLGAGDVQPVLVALCDVESRLAGPCTRARDSRGLEVRKRQDRGALRVPRDQFPG